MHLDRTSRRVLGSLVEKRFSTPEQYPLTLNSLVLACNQRSNRDPETSLQDFLVEGCLKELRVDGWVTVVERDFGRAVRYSERFCDQLGLSKPEAAVMAELMLRGPQTEQELQRRTERMCSIATLEEAVAVLEALASRGLVRHLSREIGQRVARWEHLLTPPNEAGSAAPPTTTPATAPAAPTSGLHPSGAPSGHVSWVGNKSSGAAAAAGLAHAPGAFRAPAPEPVSYEPGPGDLDWVPPPGTPEPTWSVTALPSRPQPAAPAAAAVPASPAPPAAPAAPVADAALLRDEILALKAEIAALRAEVASLRAGPPQP